MPKGWQKKGTTLNWTTDYAEGKKPKEISLKSYRKVGKLTHYSLIIKVQAFHAHWYRFTISNKS